MSILNREKALRCLRKDRVLLAGLLEGLDNIHRLVERWLDPRDERPGAARAAGGVTR